ncbi:MAG: hypothetical protein ACJ78Q_17850 [Chloroflexia bacterium]
MESRLGQHKPDQAMRKGVVQSRQGARGAKRAQALVVAVSLAVTLAGWRLFAQIDSQTSTVAQSPTPTAIVATVQQTAAATATPMASTLQVTSASQATPVVITSTSQTILPTVTPVAALGTLAVATSQNHAYSVSAEEAEEGESDDDQ